MSQQHTNRPTWGRAFARAFSSTPFIVILAVFAVAAAGMAATRFMNMSFRKDPVPLQRTLEEIPRRLGDWVQVTEDEPLDPDIQHTLGTNIYVFRRYVDTRIIGQQELDQILSTTGHERLGKIMELEARRPRAVVYLAVTYYTGMVDTVAHVPDVCYVADGYAPTSFEDRDWKVSDDENIKVRFISFEDATGFTSRVNKNVAYFFQVNGDMRCDPIAVRFSLQNLFKSDVYYAKIELMMTNIRHKEDVARVMTDFLKEAMPEIRKCLPARPGEQAKPETLAPEKAATTAPAGV